MRSACHDSPWRHSIVRSALLIACSAFAGCAYNAPVKPPQGLFGMAAPLFTSVKAPLTTNLGATPCGAATAKSASKKTTFVFPWLFWIGGFSSDEVDIESIAREGGITEISYADYEAELVFGFVGSFTVTVYGN